MTRVSTFLAAAAALLGLQVRAADSPEPARLLPASTLLYVEIPHPDRFADLLVEHPLRVRLEELNGYKRALASPQYLRFLFGKALVETQVGQGWQPALAASAAGGLAVAFDPATQGAALLAKAGDPAASERNLKVLLDLVRQDAKGKGQPDPAVEDVHRSIKIYRAGEATFAMHDGWLVAANKPPLAASILDRLLDGGDDTLAGREPFRAALGRRDPEATAWAYVDLDALRAATPQGPLRTGRTDNPAAELLFGGVVSNLRQTPYATASLKIAAEGASLAFETPHDPSWIGEDRGYFFGPAGAGGPQPLRVDRTLLSLASYRDVSQMWLRAGDLFDQAMADELAKADGNLSTFFGGRDFGEEVLGAIGPELQLVVTQQDFAERKPVPAVKLPAFALIGRLKEPAVMKGELRRAFLSVIGFVNIAGSMNGQPQLDFDLEKRGDDQTVVTRYLAEPAEAESTAARINFNFSPSLAFAGDRVVLASTETLARDVVRAAETPDSVAAETARPNTRLDIDAAVLRDLLADNREQLIAQNMLSEGRDRPEAEDAIEDLVIAAGLLRDARLELDASGGRLRLSLEANWNP